MATGDLTLVDQILHVELSDGNIVKVGSTVKSKNNDLITPAGLTMKWIINDIIVSAQNRVRRKGYAQSSSCQPHPHDIVSWRTSSVRRSM